MQNDGASTYLYSNGADVYIGSVSGSSLTSLVVNNVERYRVTSSGQHSADGAGYNGSRYPVLHGRGMGGSDTSGTTWAGVATTVTRNSANNYTATNTMPAGIGTNYHVSFCATEGGANDVYTARVLSKANGSINYVFTDDDGSTPANDIAHTVMFSW